jgi:type IV secretory pathway VirB4 component
VDEAHVFINPNYPVALDFMQQMAKRIRKYGGMQIVITQNIKDFVGSPEIARQSTAVINASQYSLIFSLAPSDLNDLVELYRKSGEINQEEQNSIVTAGVGQTFLISGPMSRTMVQIVSSDLARKLFGD